MKCQVLEVPMETCRVDFIRNWTEQEKKEGRNKITNAVLMKPETARGETVLMNLNAAGEVLSVELIKPGVKPCQPELAHFQMVQ